jgi:hypothetical protein
MGSTQAHTSTCCWMSLEVPGREGGHPHLQQHPQSQGQRMMTYFFGCQARRRGFRSIAAQDRRGGDGSHAYELVDATYPEYNGAGIPYLTIGRRQVVFLDEPFGKRIGALLPKMGGLVCFGPIGWLMQDNRPTRKANDSGERREPCVDATEPVLSVKLPSDGGRSGGGTRNGPGNSSWRRPSTGVQPASRGGM